jgi:hypothetical protein
VEQDLNEQPQSGYASRPRNQKHRLYFGFPLARARRFEQINHFARPPLMPDEWTIILEF